MSTIYLPDGAKIIIHTPWQQYHKEGVTTLQTKAEQPVLQGNILPSGIVHLTGSCSHTYYPAPIKSLTDACRLIKDKLKDLHPDDLSYLKEELENYNRKTLSWKNK